MIIEITRREVLNNLIRFKDSLLDRQGKKRGGQRRVYKVLLNRHTGDMRFARKILALEHHLTRERKSGKVEDWKEIHLIVEQFETAVNFEAYDAADHPLKDSDVDPLAWRIASETLRVLNLKAKDVSLSPFEALPEEAVLQDLSMIHLSQEGRAEEFPGWVESVDRFKAESLLMDSPIGTYLMREADPVLQETIHRLHEANGISIQGYLITVVAKESKISDILILETDLGWTLYQDDPDLKNRVYRYFPTLTALLHTLHLKNPLKLL